MNRLDCR